MGFSISVYSLGTKERYQAQNADLNFFESEDNLVPFSAEEIQKLKEHLARRKYNFVQARKLLGSGIPAEEFEHLEQNISVLLTATTLSFSATGSNATMDASMDASELKSKLGINPETQEMDYVPYFAVYDPYDGWR